MPSKAIAHRYFNSVLYEIEFMGHIEYKLTFHDARIVLPSGFRVNARIKGGQKILIVFSCELISKSDFSHHIDY